jgi:aminoglycoside phosphotransferase (APT) family kinase protein
MANDTVLFRLDGEALVARLAPAPESPYPTFPTFDLGFQQRVMELVRARTSVPVPEVLHLEASDAWLGVPFMVVRAVDGEVASDNPPYLMDENGWFLHGSPDDWSRLEASTIDVFVQLHRIVDDARRPHVVRSARRFPLRHHLGAHELAQHRVRDAASPGRPGRLDRVRAIARPAHRRTVGSDVVAVMLRTLSRKAVRAGAHETRNDTQARGHGSA